MKKFCLALILAAVTLSSVFAQVNETSRKRYALVIGNSEYTDYPLEKTVNDAVLISETLASKEFDVVLKKNLNSVNMKPVIDEFVEKVNKDTHCVALVYFAGHALTTEEKEENFLLPVDNEIIHSEEDAKVFGINLQEDIADRIKTVAQIYIIDGAYDNPFRQTGTRALGVKGGLSAAKALKQSTVGYLFSALPNKTVLTPTGKNSVFATTLASQISSSSESLSTTFNRVIDSVSVITKNEQIPYSSSTNLDFSFNGDELTALKKIRAIEEADNTSLKSYSLNKSFEEEQAALLIQKSNLSDESNKELARLTQEVEEQRQRQIEEDRMRAEEERRLAMERSEENNAEIAALRESFEMNAQLLSKSQQKDSSVEERIEYIESMKSNLKEVRDLATAQMEKDIESINENTEAKVQEIWNKEWGITEKSNGIPTEEARLRRQNREDETRAEGNRQVAARQVLKKNQIAEDDAKWLPQLEAAYKNLEGAVYTVTSLSDSLTARVESYDGSSATWKLHVSSELFGYTNLFEEEINLSYSDVTGKKKIDILKMNDEQLQAYNDDVLIYDSLFRSATPVFFVKLSYKILRWEDASEYHFVPEKCEIIRLGEKPITINTVKKADLTPSDFVMYPTVEIRSYKDKTADLARASKIKEVEAKNAQALLVKKGLAPAKSESDSIAMLDASYNNVSKKSKSESVKKQKTKQTLEHYRRGSLYAAFDYDLNDRFDLGTLDNTPQIMGGELNLTFGLTDHLYWGFGGGVESVDYSDPEFGFDTVDLEDYSDPVFYGKVVTGFNLHFGNLIRPYAETEFSFYLSHYNFNDYNSTVTAATGSAYYDEKFKPGYDVVLGFAAGGGFDVIVNEIFMFTFGCQYQWNYFTKTLQSNSIISASNGENTFNSILNNLKNPDYHCLKISAGLGFTF